MLLYDVMVRHWSFFCTYESILVFLPLCNLFNFILTFCSWFSPPSSFCSFLSGFITSHFISSCNSLLLLLLLLLLYFSLWEDTYEGQKTILRTPVYLTYEFFVFRTIYPHYFCLFKKYFWSLSSPGSIPFQWFSLSLLICHWVKLFLTEMRIPQIQIMLSVYQKYFWTLF